jgi:hypothetical protein
MIFSSITEFFAVWLVQLQLFLVVLTFVLFRLVSYINKFIE